MIEEIKQQIEYELCHLGALDGSYSFIPISYGLSYEVCISCFGSTEFSSEQASFLNEYLEKSSLIIKDFKGQSVAIDSLRQMDWDITDIKEIIGDNLGISVWGREEFWPLDYNDNFVEVSPQTAKQRVGKFYLYLEDMNVTFWKIEVSIILYDEESGDTINSAKFTDFEKKFKKTYECSDQRYDELINLMCKNYCIIKLNDWSVSKDYIIDKVLHG